MANDVKNYSVADLKSIDVDVELSKLFELVEQLLKQCNREGDGIWDGQLVSAVPLKDRLPANLTTQAVNASDAPPIGQTQVLLSVEVAYFAAQIAHKLEELDLFPDAIKRMYSQEADALLADWAETSPDRVTFASIENKEHWQKVVAALENARLVLEDALATTAEGEARAKQQVESSKSSVDNSILEALAEAAEKASGASATSDTTDGGAVAPSVPADSAAPLQSTVPADVLRTFLQPSEDGTQSAFSQRLHGAGFSSQEQHLIVDQTAWIYSGVLAQVFPNSVGHFESLDPSASAQVNQLVRDYMLQYANDPERLRGLIANPLGRRDLILDILQKNSPVLSVMAQRDQTHFENTVRLNSREATIDLELSKLQEYLLASATAQNVALTPEQAKIEAYNALSKLSDVELRSLSAGIIPVREKIYETVAKTSAKTVLAQSLERLGGGSVESLDLKNISLSLDSAILNLSGSGLSKHDVADYFTDVPTEELLLLMGVDKGNPNFEIYRTNIGSIRDAAKSYVQQKVITWSTTREFAHVSQDRAGRIEKVGRILKGGGPIAFTPKAIESAGGDSAEVAGTLTQSTTRGKKAFFKYQLERWNTLSIDEQLVAYVLTDAVVPEKYWSATPPADNLAPTLAFVEIESQVGTPEYQELVAQIAANRAAFRSRSARDKLVASFRSGGRAQIAAYSDEEIARAEAFEQKYSALWDTLSPQEKQTVYFLSGYTVDANADLALILTFVDLSDVVGSQQFDLLVNAINTADAQQIAVARAGFAFDTTLSQHLQTEVDENQREMAYLQAAAAAGVAQSPEELIMSGDENVDGRNGTDNLARFRAARAKKTAPPPISGAKKFSKEALKKGLAAVDKSIGLALTAVPGVGVGLAKAWNSSKAGKAGILGVGGLLAGSYAHALSTPLGALGGAAGGIVGFIAGGPWGAALGSYIGAMLGAHGPWGGLRWPWQGEASSGFSAAQSYGGSPASAATTAAPAAPTFSPATIPAAATTGGVLGVGAAAAGAAQAAAATAVMPALSIFSGAAMTMVVLTVIWGAFVAPSPTKPLPALPGADGETQTSAQYITVTKTATPDKIENNTPTDIEYVVSIAPKPGYRIEITGFTDEYSSFGETPAAIRPSEPVPTLDGILANIWLDNSTQPPAGQVTPPLTDEKLLIKEHSEKYYQRNVSGVDAYLINKVTVKFNVKNYLSETYVIQNQSYTTSAAVTIGEPKVGCWPVGGTLYQLPFDRSRAPYTHVNLDSFDITNNDGEPVYAPFPGTACAYPFGENGGYGTSVRLFFDGIDVGQGDQPLQLVFAHFHALSPELMNPEAACVIGAGNQQLVSGGIPVVPGTMLGFVGTTGNSTGPHLHYELYTNRRDGSPLGGSQPLLALLVPDGISATHDQRVTSCFGN